MGECYIIKTLYFVKVEEPADNFDLANTGLKYGACTRFAIRNLYKQDRVCNSLGENYVVTKSQQQQPAYQAYAVDLEVIRCKVLWGRWPILCINITIPESRGKPMSYHSFPQDGMAVCLLSQHPIIHAS